MLQRIKIQNFKGIKSGEVKDLQKVNLFVGKNDSGKSTILESAYYSLQEYHSGKLQQIMSRRTDVSTGGSELWFKYAVKYPIVISTWFEGVRLDVAFTWVPPEIVTQLKIVGKKDRKTGKRAKGILDGNHYRGRDFSFGLQFGDVIGGLPIPMKARTRLRQFIRDMVLIDCTLKSTISIIETRLAQLKIDGKDQEFGVLLKDTYSKGTEWEFLPHRDSPDETRLAIREAGRLTYLSDFGDGMRLGLGILGTAMSVRNTAIFIEEIESHQHLGSLKKLLKNLVKISRKNKLQIFITTHNADVWNSISRGVYLEDAEREKKEFRCYVVERDSDTGIVTAKHTDNVMEINRALGKP